jgi:hypothetical protein
MKRVVSVVLSCAASLILAVLPALAKGEPDWVRKRPQEAGYYIGIGVAEKKDREKDEVQRLARDRALQDLTAAIAVTVSGTFVQNVVETTGMLEEEVRSEIQTQTQARLVGYEIVDTWESRKEYWAYCRLSKSDYAELEAEWRRDAANTAVDMLERAAREKEAKHFASALAFSFQALASVIEYVGEALTAEFGGREVYLFNEIYTSVQSSLDEIELTAARRTIPFLAGQPLREPVVFQAVRVAPSGETVAVADLPLRFIFAQGQGRLTEEARTDAEGTALCHVTQTDAGAEAQTIRAEVDIDALCQDAAAKGFFTGLVGRLGVPQTTVGLEPCADEESCLWRSEFAGRRVVVLCAYEANGNVAPWPKMCDEVSTYLEGLGADVGPPREMPELRSVVDWSAAPKGRWGLDGDGDVDLVLLMVASGKLNARENRSSPYGEDFQFAGEIRTVAHWRGEAHFSDRYQGTGGWNPMGEQMCMEVLALHAVKRWQEAYRKHLDAARE